MNNGSHNLDKLWLELYKRWDDALNAIERAERAGDEVPEELKQEEKRCKKELDEFTQNREKAHLDDIRKRIRNKTEM